MLDDCRQCRLAQWMSTRLGVGGRPGPDRITGGAWWLAAGTHSRRIMIMTPHSHCGWKLICFVSMVANGLGFASDRICASEPGFQALDLQRHANQALDDDFHAYVGNNLKPLPRGRQK